MGTGTTDHDSDKGALNKIAVVPFQQALPEDSSAGVTRCPVCGSIFKADILSGEPEKIVEDIFVENLHRFRKLDVITIEKINGAYELLTADSYKKNLPVIIKQLGKEFGVDGIIFGYVYRYRERIGYPYSVKQPASVMFHIHLIRVDDGVLIWEGDFDKTQKSLMENVFQLPFFYKEKGRWLTAEELTEEGIREILKTFPGA
jgi:TolB-like protein